MSSSDISALGTYLYGGGWQTSLAKDLGVAVRTVQRWAAGQPIPTGAWAEIIERAAAKQMIDAWPVIEGLLAQRGSPVTITLQVSGCDDKVASIHRRLWSRATDGAIKHAMVPMLAAAGLEAEVTTTLPSSI